MSDFRYLAYLLLPAIAIAGFYWGGAGPFLVPLVCFIIRPLLNLLPLKKISAGKLNPARTGATIYHAVILSYVPVLLGLNVWAIIMSSNHSIIISDWTGLCLSIGIINGILGFTLAHELIHRFTPIDQLAGHLLLWMNNYLQYSIEHLGGHHRYACTPEDPHTARLNESIYEFLPRSIIWTWRNAWRIERRRLNKQNHPPLCRHNRLLWFSTLQLSTITALAFLFGYKTALFFICQSFIAIVLLNIVEYLQHYGLSRVQTPGGHYERISSQHAWDTRLKSIDLGLFHLESHSEHHMHPNRHPDQQNHHSDSPEHPAGYILMIWLAMIPPKWFRIMNPRIANLTNKKR